MNLPFNFQLPNFSKKTLTLGISLLLYSVLGYWLLVIPAKAQDISLSITPPIFEVMIQPGREVTQRYLISNNGLETPLLIKIVPFSPSDEYGSVKLEDLSLYKEIGIESWFKVDETPYNKSQRIFLPRGGNQEITLSIAPSENAPEGDYYLTLLFETDQSHLVGGQGAATNAQIGSNILLTVSKDGNPKKDSQIVEFRAPKLIDSLQSITYNLKIKNTGNAFFKPVGKIDVASLFGGGETLTLAPQNILASSTREIHCTKEEQLIRCSLSKKILFGIYNAKLKFTLDDGQKTFETQAITVAFPFSILVSFLVGLIFIKMILGKLKK